MELSGELPQQPPSRMWHAEWHDQQEEVLPVLNRPPTLHPPAFIVMPPPRSGGTHMRSR